MIRLTDEEINDTLLSLKGIYTQLDVGRILTQAQLKKVVDFIDSFKDKPVGEEGRFAMHIIKQALLKEIKEE